MKTLRPYQVKAIDNTFLRLNAGVNKLAIVLPTGTGKTVVGTNIIDRIIGNSGRALWIAHTEELISQAADALYHQTDVKPGIIKADKFEINNRIVVASAQTLYRRLDKLPYDTFDVIAADECDLFHAKSFRQSLEHFNPKLRFGLTATYYRMDNMPMEDLFDEVAFEYSLRDAVREGYLAKPIVVKLKTNTNIDSIHTVDGDFNQKELTEKVNNPARNYQIANAYLEHGQGRQFIAFCCDVQHAMDLSEAFNEKGVHCNFVVGDKKLTTDRSGVIEDFKNGNITGLTNCMVLSVGFDYSDIGVEIMACPTKSKRKYIQQLGRGFRLKSESFLQRWTQDIIVIDVVDGTSRHKLINTTELDRDLPLDEKIFISDEHRQKLMDAARKREMKLDIIDRKEDEVIELFPLPKASIIKSKRLTEIAAPEQLAILRKLGYNTTDKVYTKAMVSDIIASQPASAQDIEILRMKGFDVSNGVTIMEAKLAMKQVTN